jgi:N-acetylmuramoyl-L-alanine amidase
MAVRHQAPEFRPWVEQIAGLIGDPVKRLRFLRAAAPLAEAGKRQRWFRWSRMAPLLAAALAAPIFILLTHATVRVPPPPPPIVISPDRNPGITSAISNVWQVENSGNFEVYSNGLRIDNTYAVSHKPRSYLAFPVDGVGRPAQRAEPAGIVFHSTESQQAPFEAGHNDTLKRIGESLLDYIRRRRCYHFLIDRFGRVYRVVAEADAANHAGYSVWADDRWLYVNLNESFLGISFEAQTGHGQGQMEITEAQGRSAVMLTEMLRARYRIPAANCVTHAQVSVNPSNMRAGYHVDWASHFPFRELGLPDNYAIALPSVWAFGFECDAGFLYDASGELRRGAEVAAKVLNQRAAAAGLRPAEYRKRLQQQYRLRLAAVRRAGAALETDPP